MPPFDLLLKPSVEKDLRKIPADQAMKLLAAIDQLANSPALPPDRKLSGTERTWRKRVGDYRIIYEFDLAHHAVIIHHVRHRREAYRDL